MKKPVTMQDIAAEAGVTAATVSLIFRCTRGRVSEATRENVLRLAREMGYRPDPYLSTLMNKRRKGTLPKSSPVLAFASAHPTADSWRDHSPTFVNYFEGARERAAEKGFRLEHFWLGKNGAQARRASQIMYTRNIKGILLAPLPDFLSFLDLEWERFHTVALGFSLTSPVLDRVTTDHLRCMALAVDRCRFSGYRRIGLILNEAYHQRVDRRSMAGFLMEQERSSEEARVAPLLTSGEDKTAVAKWIRQERPDAIIAPYSGGWLQSVVRSLGLRVPEDVGIAELDLPQNANAVSGVFEHATQLGARAIDLLAAAVHRNESGIPEQPTTVFTDSVWVAGPTLRGELATSRPPVGVPKKTPKKSHVTVRDVAARIGVSAATVSLALKGSPKVSAATQSKVIAAARELGYRKNPYLSELMRNTRGGTRAQAEPVLAFLTACPDRGGWKTCYLFYEYLLGARRRAEELGFRLEEIWIFDPAMGKEPSEALLRRGIQGVMFSPFPSEGAQFPFHWDAFCSLAFGFTPFPDLPFHRVANDHYRSVRRAIQECRALGYKRIGLAMGAVHDDRVQNRWSAAFFLNQHEHPVGVSMHSFMPETWNRQTLVDWVKQEKPDVILSCATGDIRTWLSEEGYAIPHDFGLVSLNLFGPRRESVAGIDQDGDLLGSRAVDFLVGLIERGEYGLPEHPTTLLMNGKWSSGKTLCSQGQVTRRTEGSAR